jgi:hypothetical protein
MPRHELRNTTSSARFYSDADFNVDPMLFCPPGNYRARAMSDERATDLLVPTLTVVADQASPPLGSTVTWTTNAPNGVPFSIRRNGTEVATGIVGTDALSISTTGYTAGDAMTCRVLIPPAVQDVTSAAVTLAVADLYTKYADFTTTSGATQTITSAIPDVGYAQKVIVQAMGDSTTTAPTCTIAGVTATLHLSLMNDSLAIAWVWIADIPANTPGNIVFTRGTSIAGQRVRYGWVPATATIDAAVTAGGSGQNVSRDVSQTVAAGSAIIVGGAFRGGTGTQSWSGSVTDVLNQTSGGSSRSTFGFVNNASAGALTLVCTTSGEIESRRDDVYSIEVRP